MAPLKWRTVGYDLKPSPCPVQVSLLLASRLLDLAGMTGQVGWALTLTGWDAVSLNSLPDRAVLTQLLNAG